MKWLRRILAALGAVFALMTLAGWIVLQRLVEPLRNGPARYAAELAALRRDSFPTQASELQRPIPPDAVNAAPDWLAFGKELEAHPVPTAVYEAAGHSGTLSPAELRQVGTALHARAALLALIHRAAIKPYCVVPRRWEQGPAMDPTGLSAFREAERLLSLESALLVQRGQFHQAIEVEALGLRVSEQAASEPTVICGLVAAACRTLALRSLLSILQKAGTDAAVCAHVQQVIRQAHGYPSLENGMRGEIWFAIASRPDVIRRFGKKPAEGRDDKQLFLPEERQFMLPTGVSAESAADANLAVLLSYYHALGNAARLPEAVRASRIREVQRKAARELTNPGSEHMDHSIASEEIPVMLRVYESFQKVTAWDRVTFCSAAVLEYHAVHHHWPARLQDAVQPPPGSLDATDPFTERPLQYRQEERGFVLYSVGETGHYDGRPVPDGKAQRESVFRYRSA